MLCLSYYAYVFSSTKLEIRAERFCLEVRRGEGQRVEVGSKGGEMAPKMYACTCE
jgi:hypothetical protein